MTSLIDLGEPAGRDAGFRHPAVVVIAQRILDADPNVVQVVPLTATIRQFGSEVPIEPDTTNRLDAMSARQCQHIRAVSSGGVEQVPGNVGAVVLARIRDIVGLILDIQT